MPLINYEINHILTLSANCIIFEGNRVTTFAVADTTLYVRLYVPAVTLSTQNNANLLEQLKFGLIN